MMEILDVANLVPAPGTSMAEARRDAAFEGEELRPVTSDAPLIQTESAPEQAMGPEALSDQQKALLSFEHFSNLFVKQLFFNTKSKKKMIRAAQAVAKGLLHPLSKDELKFESFEEQELFDLFQEASSAKMMLMMYGLEQSGAITINKKLKDMVPQPEVQQNETKEETNGKQ